MSENEDAPKGTTVININGPVFKRNAEEIEKFTRPIVGRLTGAISRVIAGENADEVHQEVFGDND